MAPTILDVDFYLSSTDGPTLRLAGASGAMVALRDACERLASGEPRVTISDLDGVNLSANVEAVEFRLGGEDDCVAGPAIRRASCSMVTGMSGKQSQTARSSRVERHTGHLPASGTKCGRHLRGGGVYSVAGAPNTGLVGRDQSDARN